MVMVVCCGRDEGTSENGKKLCDNIKESNQQIKK